MKVHFISSSDYYKTSKKEFTKTKELIEKIIGNEVTTYADMGGKEIGYDSNEKDIVDSIKKDEQALKAADMVIADITQSSAGPGYDIANALNLKKPVLVMKRESKEDKRTPHTMTVKDSKLLTFSRYNDTSLEKMLRKFINSARQKLDTKFILIISPEIDRYLEWASDYKRMHKAQIVRNAVEDMLEKDKEYTQAQKEA
ncbi:MAG TPA: hypothetical protein ENI23_01450 [bacterium]|nr:hypothetical protein [bacterium]